MDPLPKKNLLKPSKVDIVIAFLGICSHFLESDNRCPGRKSPERRSVFLVKYPTEMLKGSPRVREGWRAHSGAVDQVIKSTLSRHSA